MGKKLLTIIIPTYNMELYLHRCLSSLVINDKDLMVQLEILVVIDGSTDKSADIAKGYEALYPDTFRVIEKENGHYGSCINRGLKEATGKYIKILDADDNFDNDAFYDFVKQLSTTDVDMVINYAVMDKHNGEKMSFLECTPVGMKELENLGKPFTFETLRYHHKGYIAMHNSTYRTELLREINYTQLEGVCYTDIQWTSLPLTHVKSIVLFPHKLYHYFVGREGQSMDPNIRRNKFGDIKAVTMQLNKEYTEYRGDAITTNYLKESVLNRIERLYIGGLANVLFNESDIREFDKELKIKYPDIYNAVATHKIPIGCKLYITIDTWRKHDAAWFRFMIRCIRFTGRMARIIIGQ